MLRSILIGLDGSPAGEGAVELGLQWARRNDAMLVGIGIIDEPTIRNREPVPLGAGPYKVQRDATLLRDARLRIEETLDQFARRCQEAGVTCKLLEDVGQPHEQILQEAQRFDLVLLGRETHFRFETQDRPDETLVRVVKHGPRPVVAVPPRLPPGQAAVVAYDGSLQASRALFAFWASGLAAAMPLHVVSIGEDLDAGKENAERAASFLRAHLLGVEIHAAAAEGDVAATLLHKARELDAGLLVAGAFGQPALREFFLGSVTRTLLREGDIPLFLTH